MSYITYLELPAADSHSSLVVACVAVVAAGGVIEPLVRGVGEVRRVSDTVRVEIEQAAMGLLDAIDRSAATPLTFRDVGVTVFLARLTLLHPFDGGVQQRVARVRFNALPRPTTIRWTRHKGVLGECWEHRAVRGLPHKTTFSGYVRHRRVDWWRLPRDVKRGLSLKDMRAVAEYGYVEAHPMIDHKGSYRGCLVVQVEERYQRELEKPEVRSMVAIIATSMCGVLGG